MKITICRMPDLLAPNDGSWNELAEYLAAARPGLVLLNEMPFGPWIAASPQYDPQVAASSVELHETALGALAKLPAAVLGTRPVHGIGRLANEAFLLAEGEYRRIHHKHYFPQEPGFHERSWFAASRPGFDVIEFHGLRIGVLICTELMFTEWARHYRRQGAHVIVCPRASGRDMECWNAAARMAAIVSGCYVLSSNRLSHGNSRPHFGGRGFAYSPTGELLGVTSKAAPALSIRIDPALVEAAQRRYPCYVEEIADDDRSVTHAASAARFVGATADARPPRRR